ncbi:MAG: glycosyltransferase [Rhodobacteraceae bacterium]|nr:glycosyltransferase [Paracoccaceae bacterium]
MLTRLTQLFRRYAVHNVSLSAPGPAVLDEHGQLFGHIDLVRLARGRFEVHGWTTAERVSLWQDAIHSEVTPGFQRTDVLRHHPAIGRDTLGFVVSVPAGEGAARIVFRRGAERYVFPLPGFGARQIGLARLRVLPGFLWRLLRSLPAALDWYANGSITARSTIKQRLGLDTAPDPSALSPDLFSIREPGPAAAPGPVTIVFPVFNALAMLPDALDRVLRHTDLPWHLIVVEDCSTDAGVRPFLKSWHAGLTRDQRARVTLIENPRNLGFIGSVNKAFKLAMARDGHVILLNSDAFVPAGWASRLVRPILTHENVASVTPMSNDAEIFSVPVICQRSNLRPGEADLIDAVASGFNPDTALCNAPTGVGFCMALNRRYLEKEPQFDTVFGRGYGEEVDWCQKIKKRGGRHIGHSGLFVEHRGGTSFGSVEKLKLVQDNNAIVTRRYPEYDRQVQDFIRHDPLSTPRLALAIAWAAYRAPGKLPIFLAHTLGGGAEHYLARRIAREVDAAGAVIVLRAGGALRWSVECHSAHGVTQGATNDSSVLQSLLKPVTARRLVYSCGVGDHDPADLPRQLLSLIGKDDELEVLVHDYFMVSPSYCLLDGQGSYTGLPDPKSDDPAHSCRRPDGRVVTLARWQRSWGKFLARADEIVVFSQDSKALIASAYPGIAARIRLRPHALSTRIAEQPRQRPKRPVIGILGNIGRQKGADVVRRLAEALEASGTADLVVVGNIAPEYQLSAKTQIHGSYQPSDIPALIARYKITAWFIPSIWPETFSFTTHEALATGLPVFCFDIGAQAEAVARAPNGHVLPFDRHPGPITDIIGSLLEGTK